MSGGVVRAAVGAPCRAVPTCSTRWPGGQLSRSWERLPHRRRVEARGGSNNGSEPSPQEDAGTSGQGVPEDVFFLAKMLAVSFAGGAVIKYGSLLSDIPFEPSPTLAVSLVLGTPAFYALYLLSQGKEQI